MCKWGCLILILLLEMFNVGLATIKVEAHFGGNDVFKLMKATWEATSSELMIIADKDHLLASKRILKLLMENNIPSYLFTVGDLVKNVEFFPKPPCPILTLGSKSPSPTHVVMKRNPVIMAESKKPKSIFFLLSPSRLESGVELINKTIWSCPQSLDFGIFGENSNIFFFVENFQDSLTLSKEYWLAKHPHLYIAQTDRAMQRSLLFCPIPCKAEVYSTTFGLVANVKDNDFISKVSHTMKGPKHFFNRILTATTLVEGYGPNEIVAPTVPMFDIRMIGILEKSMNFSTSIINSYKGINYIKEDGSYGGAIGIMQRHEVELGLEMGSFRLILQKVSKLAHLSLKTPLYRTLLAPPPQSFPKSLTLIRPFQLWVWLALAISLLLTPIVLSFFATLEEKLKNHKFPQYSRLTEASWYCIGTLCGESILELKSYAGSNSLRIVILIWLFFCFLLTAAYAGCLYSFMSNPGTLPPINSFDEAIESNLRVDWALYGFDGEENFVQMITDKRLEVLYQRKTTFSYFSGQDSLQAMQRVFEGKSILVAFSKFLDLQISVSHSARNGDWLIHWPKHLNLNDLPWTFMVTVFPKLSPYGENIKRNLLYIFDAGISDKEEYKIFTEYRNDFLDKGGSIPTLNNDSFDSFSLDDVQGYFYFFGLFNILGLVILVIEFIVVLFAKRNGRNMAKRGGNGK